MRSQQRCLRNDSAIGARAGDPEPLTTLPIEGSNVQAVYWQVTVSAFVHEACQIVLQLSRVRLETASMSSCQ
jgi:hypothetical protein